MGLLTHIYSNVETYVAMLAWITVPLGFYAAYLFFGKHYGIFPVVKFPYQDKKD